MLKPEEINGKMYQPACCAKFEDKCGLCSFGTSKGNGYCSSLEIFDGKQIPLCMNHERPDNLDVYYINIECE
jgi:hypothetical protein